MVCPKLPVPSDPFIVHCQESKPFKKKKMSKFNDLIKGETPVLVDFHATWCGPCKQLSPIIEEIAVDLKGKIKVIKIDIDKNQKAAEVYQIKGVPTMILFHKGKILWKQSGVMPKQNIIGMINQHI